MSSMFLDLKIRALLILELIAQNFENFRRALVASMMWVDGYTEFEIELELQSEPRKSLPEQ